MDTDPMRVLTRSIIRASFQDLPPAAVRVTKEHLTHMLACILAGSSAPGCAALAKLVSTWGGAPQSHLLVFGEKVPAVHAAMVHAAMAHALEFEHNDDRIAYKSSTAAIPAALATAERLGNVSGRDLITAVCLGVEVGIRLGLATNPRPAHGRVPRLGPFAAAAACGKLMGLDEEALLDAFGIAFCGVSISGSSNVSPSLTKRLVAGLAARNGVFAAELAALGYPANRNILSGDEGYFRLFTRQDGDFEVLVGGLGERFEMVEVGPKGYPSCRRTHPPIDAMLNLTRRHDLKPEQVSAITVIIAQRDLKMVGGVDNPARLEARRQPRGVVDAQFSIPYTVARALVDRRVSLDHFTPEALREPAVLDLARRVTVQADPELDRWSLDVKPAVVEVVLTDGQRFAERVDYPKGSPRNPVSAEEIRQNFRACARFAAVPLPERTVDAAFQMLESLEQVENVSELVTTLGGECGVTRNP